jgi:ribosomal protein S5
VVKATMRALLQLQDPEEIMARRGLAEGEDETA